MYKVKITLTAQLIYLSLKALSSGRLKLNKICSEKQLWYLLCIHILNSWNTDAIVYGSNYSFVYSAHLLYSSYVIAVSVNTAVEVRQLIVKKDNQELLATFQYVLYKYIHSTSQWQ